ncbi:DUF1512 domain-containing protein [Staphylothermus hellenicus]|uniref:DUF1512 domain-containing protein n=1 Tax=Staphylothermus hellenicus (strain DSM 12710 / JCM 10830 / BK20S6-10-b1 / P8) TaxID=591019 RepID=D7DA66_STAHD|nr:DUF1512 domain-containing protein [Staphylothermus hellenicus]ADI32662.1 Protein of unknown function DUF1512 [Staphylothermus hellenicus DSM 12710]
MANTDWGTIITQLIWLLFFIMIFTGANQKIQMKLWSIDIRNKLSIIKRYIDEDQARIENILKNLGVQTPSVLIKRANNFFTIDPVTIEPTDIIKRMEHLIRTSDKSFRKLVSLYLPSLDKHERSLVETSISILSTLNLIYKVIKHYLISSEKENNWVLLMQLELIMPQIMKLVETYHEALDPFITGKPIGDGAGPLIAHRIIENGRVVSKKVVEDTSITEVWLDNRRIFIIKAEGPGSNVGRPGYVLAKIVDELRGSVDLIITIDAALKLESEERGEIAEGVGAAIGDPGPEKIAIERAATKYEIPLRALVVKMDLEDAIYTMKKDIYEACERAYEYVRKLVKELTTPKSTIIIAGIGNTMGVPG